jgi:hypothetical protein
MGVISGSVVTQLSDAPIKLRVGSVDTLVTDATNTLVSFSGSEDIVGFIVDGTHPGVWWLRIGGALKIQASTTGSELSKTVLLGGRLPVDSTDTAEIAVENVSFESADYHVTVMLDDG